MKHFLTPLLILLFSNCFSQELPTEPENGFVFPLGSKFTIKMHPIDSLNYHYSIIKFEPFQETVDIWETDSLFSENGIEETIEFYFCLGTRGETDVEKEKNMKVLLIMKNRTNRSFNYYSEIQTEEEGEFKETSNVGTYSGAKGTEMWPYMIYTIGLTDFKKMK